MPKTPVFLDVEVRDLPEVRVIHQLLLFHSNAGNPDGVIRPAFKRLRQKVSESGLDPDALLHIGIPEVVEGELVSYECCIEMPLPEGEPARLLPGGRYAVLMVEKTPARIGAALRAFRGEYLLAHDWIVDEARPVYEIYFKDVLEYCLPIH